MTVQKVRIVDDEIVVQCMHTKKKTPVTILSDYVIGAIGRLPNLDYFSEKVKENVKDLMNEKKIYIIGDAHNDLYRQVGISVGDGIKTAMEIHTMYYRENP